MLPQVDAAMMNLHLAAISARVAPGAHAVMPVDGAGWHQPGGRLRVPDNITLLRLPPYSPELNPVERLWGYLRSHYLSNRAYDDYRHLLDAGARAWQQLTPETLRSVCACPYLEREIGR